MQNQVVRIRRMLHLLERLQSGRTHNAQELAEFCGVSRRTLFRDMKILQQSGVTVLYNSQRQGYWIAQGVMLPPTELSLVETLSLIILSQELGDAEHGVPFQEPAAQAGMKLLSNLPGHLRAHVGELTGKVQLTAGQIAELSGAQRYYQLVIQAILEKRRLRVQYDSLYEQKVISTLISPYRLLFMHRAWYVIGRSSLHRSVRTFHLGRFVGAELTDDSYEIPPRFSLQSFFGDAWRMIRRRKERYRIRVRFAPLVAKNVAEVAWHRTQSVTWHADGSMDYQVEVEGLEEISWWILGYGDKAVVQEPVELRELIARHIQNMAGQYGLRVLPEELADVSEVPDKATGKKQQRRSRKTD